MPLAVQVLLPFAVLLGTAVIVRRPSSQRQAPLLGAGGTALAALLVLSQLLQLSPRARVDLLYLHAFPGADPAVRVDGLSLAVAVIMLVTAAGLMLARSPGRFADRRTPVAGWLLTTTASLAVILAGNLLLTYVALQLVTLTWTGALDESSRRVRRLRLSQQLADLGLLGAAAAMIQSAGTSAFAGLPSDALGPLGFGLALLPAVVRLAPLVTGIQRPATPVFFEPAVAWVAPAGYLVLRLAALTGGPPPGRLLQIAVFGFGIVGAAMFCGLALAEGPWPLTAGRLLGVQAGLALAFASVGSPVMIVASTWLWLLIIPLAGLCALGSAAGSAGRAMSAIGLTMLPPGAAFAGLWLGLVGLAQMHQLAVAAPVAAIVAAATVAASRGLGLRRPPGPDVPAVWGAVLITAGTLPAALMTTLALPAARAVRSMPPDAVTVTLFGIQSAGASLPALPLALLSLGTFAFVLLRYDRWIPRLRGWRGGRLKLALPVIPAAWIKPAGQLISQTTVGWALFAALAAAMALR